MKVYIRTQDGKGLIEKGKLLAIGGAKSNHLITGDDEIMPIALGEYDNEEITMKVFLNVAARVVYPTEKEIERGIIYIDLQEIEKGIK